MKLFKFSWGGVTARWPWVLWVNHDGIIHCGVDAATIVSFWKWKREVPKDAAGWQVNLMFFGFGVQITNEVTKH